MASGLYIVTLNNEDLISVNAHDRRRAENCLEVNKAHCKFGKARDLAKRQSDYEKTFGRSNVNFEIVAFLDEDDIDLAEPGVLALLAASRMRGLTGRPNEWLQEISAVSVRHIALDFLSASGLSYRLPEQVTAAPVGV